MDRIKNEAGLTARQEKFCHEYIANGANAKAAAIAASYSPNGAEVTGSQLLRHPKVSARIAELTTKAAGPLDMSAEEIVQESGCHYSRLRSKVRRQPSITTTREN